MVVLLEPCLNSCSFGLSSFIIEFRWSVLSLQNSQESKKLGIEAALVDSIVIRVSREWASNCNYPSFSPLTSIFGFLCFSFVSRFPKVLSFARSLVLFRYATYCFECLICTKLGASSSLIRGRSPSSTFPNYFSMSIRLASQPNSNTSNKYPRKLSVMRYPCRAYVLAFLSKVRRVSSFCTQFRETQGFGLNPLPRQLGAKLVQNSQPCAYP